MFTLMTVASNIESSEDQTAHSRLSKWRFYLCTNWRPEWLPTYTAQLVCHSSFSGKHGRSWTACSWRCCPSWHLGPVPVQIAINTKWCVYNAYYATVLVYANRSWLHCRLFAAANFIYIVVSQDVVIGAVVLLMHVLVETSKILFMLLPFSMRHQHICALILGTHLSSFNSNYFWWLICISVSPIL